VPNPSGKMNDRERGICSRVKEFRERIKWSQSDFAEQLGLTRDQIAGIENFRTPLRYDVAWKIRDVFGFSLSSLADKYFSPDSEDLDAWPAPQMLNKGQSLLSEVESSLWEDDIGKPHARTLHKKKSLHQPQRSTLLSILSEDLLTWMASVPDDKVQEFTSILVTVANDYLDKLPKDSLAKMQRRRTAMMWDAMRLEIAKRLLGKSAANSYLTNTETPDKQSGVKAQLPSLLERLNRATNETGKMSALADYLKVPLASVSRWLSRKREPGGEITLKLLRWVEQQERQK
jgi:transcriptional regulator with XRE-family HTH domain